MPRLNPIANSQGSTVPLLMLCIKGTACTGLSKRMVKI
jgi:hypothetical protein